MDTNDHVTFKRRTTQQTRNMDYKTREEKKDQGNELYNSGRTLTERCRGLLMVIEAHYYRNEEAPSFATYASHWLWASQGQYDESVLNALIVHFPLPSRPRIQRGFSDWDSFGMPNYKAAA